MTTRTRKPQRDLFTFRPLRHLLRQIRHGLTPEAAAHSAGVSLKVLKLSLSKGVEDLENPTGDQTSRDARLVIAIRKQEAVCQAAWVGLLHATATSHAYTRTRTETPTKAVVLAAGRVASRGKQTVERGLTPADGKSVMFLLERRFPREWGPVATASDMHTAAAVDLLRQGVAELKRGREAVASGKQPPALGNGETVVLEVARAGVDVRPPVRVSYVQEEAPVANVVRAASKRIAASNDDDSDG